MGVHGSVYKLYRFYSVVVKGLKRLPVLTHAQILTVAEVPVTILLCDAVCVSSSATNDGQTV